MLGIHTLNIQKDSEQKSKYHRGISVQTSDPTKVLINQEMLEKFTKI